MNTRMNSEIVAIKHNVDLLTYVSRDVKLTRSGKSYRGHCPHPNHKDTEPSFFVGLNRHGELVASCFGCGRTNMVVINYVQWRDGVDFGTAIAILSQETDEPVTTTRDPIYTHQLLVDVMDLAREQLRTSEEALEYLTVTRGISQDVLDTAGLGYVADGYKLIQELIQKGYSWSDLRSVGLVSDKHRCRFVGRILFPLWNHAMLQAIAGRQLRNDDKYVRYLYTETEIPALYTFSMSPIDPKKPVFLVEGLVDLLSARIMGYRQSVALVSTAYTHHPDLERLGDYRLLYVLMHEDDAGTKALEVLLNRFGDKIVPMHLPVGYKDLNDALLDGRDHSWLRTLASDALRMQQVGKRSAS